MSGKSIEARMIEDTVSRAGVRLTTLQLRYPRFIHAEFMTHRVFSRNASSSRAIPVLKSISSMSEAPAEPIHWGLNQPGMQAESEIDEAKKNVAQALWLEAATCAARFATSLAELGVHKQVANRLIEPFTHISVIVTATEWSNFFQLRDHSDAQPEIRRLACEIKQAMSESVPRVAGEDPSSQSAWHLPYILAEERAQEVDPSDMAKISAARCARVSYLTHDGQHPSQQKDLALYERLVGSHPIHASPIEHQAVAMSQGTSWSRNLRGWRQFRELVEQAPWPAR